MPNNSNHVLAALDTFRIEVPSWGFADTGTRFGKFLQDSAASTLEEKFADAGQVHHFTGICPTVALHVLWDIPAGTDLRELVKLSDKYGVHAGSINPNVFQDQDVQARLAWQSNARWFASARWTISWSRLHMPKR